MAFNDNGENIKNELKKMGAKVIINERDHSLTVNDKYIYWYINGYFQTIEGESLGRGVQDFFKLI